MKIGLDMMGGDYAPLEAVKGIQLYNAQKDKDTHLVLVGDEEQIHKHLNEQGLDPASFTIVHASQVIDMHEHPTKAFKEKQNSSIFIGFHLLASGKIDA